MTVRNRASERIDIRISAQHKKLIETAARTVGLSVTQFVTTRAVSAAESTLEEQRLRTLSEKDRRAFMKMLDHAEPNEALKTAAARFVARYGR